MNKIEDLINKLCPDGVPFYELGELGTFFGGLTGKSKGDFIDGNAKFILENIIAKIPSELKGKAREKWCNEKCKELFVRQGYRKYFGYGLAFPIINGKPLKFCGFEIDKNTYRSDEIYINEDTNEKFKYIRKTVDAKTKKVLEYEIIKL